MAEYIRPGIRECYSYQPNVLECWASVAITLWRSKYGRRGAGHDTDALFARRGGERYMAIMEYTAELNMELPYSYSLDGLDQAEARVRRAQPRFVNTPSGLPSTWANSFFTWLGCSSTALDASTTPETIKTLLRDKGPIAIFTHNPGHLQLIVGWWEGDPAAPQLILFNPERYILEIARTGDPNLPVRNIREDRLLWQHWQSYYCGNLVDAKGWHY